MIAHDVLTSQSGSYFGVDSYGAPLFTWFSTPSYDDVPDTTRAPKVGNTYGIYLHR